ncbi:helix-turn-helix domain-containing protein [Nocardia amamiensis]|uniref:Helix-turn-helix domain-containing protein n=1 Tax=Nocardia amamiensis TaxID=404578 RepID=A0ABS0CWR5_9NOCA|nr:helix-turn-helix transcriptional regulator [Nocardia amamiensis]MBF6300318.1 helix-turn-helix domain-containing protein [Nocardia amamiensis]
MTSGIDDDTIDAGPSSTLPRRQLGRFLRESREASGFTLAAAAKLVDLSPPALQRIETGQTQKVRKQDVRALCELYGVSPEDTQRAIDLADLAKTQSWYHAYGGLFSTAFNMYLGLEPSARRLTQYHEQVPGLLQTPDYARALISAFYRGVDPEEINRRVELRMKRQAIITRNRSPLRLELLLHESALRRNIGGPKVMSAQLRHLAEVSKLPNVTVRIQPYEAGMTWGILHGPFSIMEFDTNARGKPVEPPIVYLEGGPSADVYLEKPEEVQLYSGLASDIRGTCLDEVRTRELIRRVTKEYEQ